MRAADSNIRAIEFNVKLVLAYSSTYSHINKEVQPEVFDQNLRKLTGDAQFKFLIISVTAAAFGRTLDKGIPSPSATLSGWRHEAWMSLIATQTFLK